MPGPAQSLLELQQLDVEIGRLTRRLQQIDSSLGDQIKLKAADLAIRQAEQVLQASQRGQRDVEMELASVEARVKDHERRLYSGGGSPRELQALQRDIEHDKARKDELEGQTLAAMDAVEKDRAEVERVKKAVARVLGAQSADQHKLVAERLDVREQVERLTERRAQAAAQIDSGATALYERLHQRQPDGLAVAEIVQGRCEGCRTNLPSTEVQRARRSETAVQCSACGRILVAG